MSKTNRQPFCLLIAIFALSLFSCSSASACPDLLFTSSTAVGSDNLQNAYRSGLEFTVGAEDISVKGLGVYDALQDGLSQDHQVGIWDTDAGTLVASANVTAGSGDLIDIWRFVDLATPVTLNASSTYRIAAQFNYTGVADDLHAFGGTPVAGAGVASISAGEVYGFGAFAYPSGVGPNRRLNANAIVGVPEPTSVTLFSLSIVAMTYRRRRRRA